MKRWHKVLLGVAAVLLVLVGVVLTLLRTTAQRPAECQWKLDLALVRQAASELPGQKPTALRVERVATLQMPEAVVVTGGPFALTQMPVYAYQLVLGEQTLIIDSALTEDATAKMHGGEFDPEAWARLTRAMASAGSIYVTHEHADHLDGLATALSDPKVARAARLTPEQLANAEGMKPVVIPAGAVQPFSYERVKAVAPGVVLIKAAGHTPGSQLVYVQRDDGREVILTGDTAWHDENVDRVLGPPKLMHLLMGNDDTANVCQLAALHDAREQDPKLRVMPGHDGRRMAALLGDGTFVAHFE